MTHSSNCIHYYLVLSKTLLLMTLNLEQWAAPPCNRWKGVFAGCWERVCIWCRKGCLGMSPFYYRSWTCASEDHLEFKDISFYRWETHSFIHQQIHKERLLNARFSSRCSGDIEQKTQGSALMVPCIASQDKRQYSNKCFQAGWRGSEESKTG